MVFINIPYVPENDGIDRTLLADELKCADISESARYEAFDAIFNRIPRGVRFDISETNQSRELVSILLRMRIGYRITEESEYKYENPPARS